ncbi:hypothetical protein Tco_0088757 [Tanacetum coccineum]
MKVKYASAEVYVRGLRLVILVVLVLVLTPYLLRTDVSASDWSANDWSASEGTKILYADQSGADTSALVSPYHVHHNGYFTSPPDRRYTNVVIDWILGKSLDEGCGTSIYGYSDSDLRNHPPWSSECKNEKRQQSQDLKEKVEQGMQRDLHTLNDDDDLLQLDDPILLKSRFKVQRREKRDMEHESASAIVTFRRANKRRRLNPADKTEKGMEDTLMEANGLRFHL